MKLDEASGKETINQPTNHSCRICKPITVLCELEMLQHVRCP